MTMRRKNLLFLILFFLTQNGIAFQTPSPKLGLAPPLFSSGGLERLPNEFSRTYRVDRILSGGARQRDYNIKVEADEEERRNLAYRFDLQDIYHLEAEVALRRENMSEGKTPGVEVEGTIEARVTQVCVRTGEVFDVDVQFPLFCIVRPLASSSDGNEEDDVPAAVLDYERNNNKNRKKNKKGGKRENGGVKTQALQQMDIMEIQKLLQDIDVEDDVMEDESIYSSDGTLDVGELVAQMFWLKLDPYPRKPGTSFEQISISG